MNVPRQHSEHEVMEAFKTFASQNATGYSSFLGAGAYRHYRPVLIDSLSQRGEFLTSYTPYQPEIAQGTLQALFEFQTMICELTGMDIANASMYDGSTGAAEAVMMAVRVTGRKRRRDRAYRASRSIARCSPPMRSTRASRPPRSATRRTGRVDLAALDAADYERHRLRADPVT